MKMTTRESGSFFPALCHECDQLQQVSFGEGGGRANCVRCGAELHHRKENSVDRTLALAITAGILFIIANAYPFLGFRIGTQVQQSSLMTGIIELYRQGLWLLATLVLFTTVVVPGFQILGVLYAFFPLRVNWNPPHRIFVFRLVRMLQPWGMTEVFMLGILVAVVKLAKMATILPGVALYAFMALMGVLAGIMVFADPKVVWEAEGRTEEKRGAFIPGTRTVCPTCHFICEIPAPPARVRCPRCGAMVHQRKHFSIQRTWAFVIAAFIFYIPANLLPITQVISLGKAKSDTIVSGVLYFLETGMWPIALVIFTASILVPLFKLVILTGLLISVQRRSAWRPRDRAVMYRITEAVGRWSMLDIFVVTILVALVRLGVVASVEVGAAAVYFAAVVVCTMLAAMSFDPRSIWDALEIPHAGRKN